MNRVALGVIVGLMVVGGDLDGRSRRNPIPQRYPSPLYPMEMEGSGLDGRVTLAFVVTEYGTVIDPEVLEASHPAFGYAAMAVIGSWRFKPALRNGEQVRIRVLQPFVFRSGPTGRVNAVLGRVVYEIIEEPIFSPVEVGGLPEITYHPIAPYPRKYRGSGQVEVIHVTMTVGPDGRGYNMEIEGYPPKEFVLAAIVAATGYRFEPTVFRGEKVYVYTRVSIVVSEEGHDRSAGYPDDPYEDYPDF